MARPLRIEYPGALYHVTSRGNARADIVGDDGDRQIFVDTLSATVDRFGWLCHAWCLMDHHYHVLVVTPAPNLSRGMRHLNGVFTQRLNRRHGRVGHVFQGRYKAILVERAPHLLELCRYVVLNPVRAGMARRVRDWRWSSYRGSAGLARARRFEHRDWILAQFGAETDDAVRSYRRFVADGIGAPSPWDTLSGPDVLGGAAFRDALREKAGMTSSEVPSRARRLAPATLAALRRRHGDRGEWMARAYREHGHTMRRIADAAGLHYSTVSKIIKKWETQNNSTFKT